MVPQSDRPLPQRGSLDRESLETTRESSVRSWHTRPPILHELVAAQARQSPDQPAAVYDDQVLAYRELVARAASWSARLRAAGVDVGVRVGLHLERSLELPVLVLGVLGAGGVGVPLDPANPPGRIAAILRDVEPALVLSDDPSGLPATRAPIVAVDGALPSPASAPETRLDGGDEAFVLFTSGSTGTPKGVVLSHANVAARNLRPEQDLPGPGHCLAILKTSMNHNPFLGEMFGSLLHGCYFAIARPGGHQDVAYLGSLIIEHHIRVLSLPTALLRAFLEWPGAVRCSSLKQLHTGGEATSEEIRERFFEILPTARLVIGYGTTEVGSVTNYECRSGERLGDLRIGRPVDGAEVHLLDAERALVSPGDTGELYLGGPRLALGYLNRPEETAARFVEHPFNRGSGQRLYRTGDLARLRPDGDLEFVGRADHQIKLRGLRIEPEEIETVLQRHPAVAAAAVARREDDPGSARLVAYLVPVGSRLPAASELREFAGSELPTPLIPASYRYLDELPLTLSGKIDRRRLAHGAVHGPPVVGLPNGDLALADPSKREVTIAGRPIRMQAIEAALREHESVLDAVVLPAQVETDDAHLCAFVATRESISSLSLRRLLKRSLPPEGIPRSFVFLNELPRLADGSPAFRELPSPREIGRANEPPATDTEEQIARIWCDALGIERVGRNDNFFDLGGESLISARVVIEIERELGIRLRLRDLLLQSLCQLAQRCEELARRESGRAAARDD